MKKVIFCLMILGSYNATFGAMRAVRTLAKQMKALQERNALLEKVVIDSAEEIRLLQEKTSDSLGRCFSKKRNGITIDEIAKEIESFKKQDKTLKLAKLA